MDRREVLKASVAGAAAMGVSAGTTMGRYAKAQGSSPAAAAADAAPPPLVSVSDYEAAAKRKLSVPAWEYFSSGSADEITLRRNRSALDELQLKPHVLVDVTRIDTGCTLLGFKMEYPILLAPTSSHQLAHPDAELATARGAGAAKAIMVASTNSNRSIEDICKAATQPIWFQLYVDDDRNAVRARSKERNPPGARPYASR